MTPPTGQSARLTAGDRLTRDEFERRYTAMPDVKKAELIEGVVYMPSPVSHARHSGPHARAVAWIGAYAAATPGTDFGDNASLRLDLDNEPQPDLLLRLDVDVGGQSRISADGYIEGAPELIVEVSASRASYDLHDKLHAYRRNGVREYVVWRVDDAALDWFVLRGSAYENLASAAEPVLRSETFKGLWLDVRALLAGDLHQVLATVQLGIDDEAHGAFVEALAERRARV